MDRYNVKMPNIPGLINSVKMGKISDEMKFEIKYTLEMFGYYIMTLIHDDRVFDIFAKEHRFILITLLNECYIEFESDPQSPRLASFHKFLRSIDGVRPESQTKIMRKIYRMDTVKKIDRVWHLLRDLYDVTIGQEYITKAYLKYSDRGFSNLYPQTLPNIFQEPIIIEY